MILKGQRPPRVALGPRNRGYFGRSIRPLQTRHPRTDRRLTLHGVQMPPFPLLPSVDLSRAPLAVFPAPTLLDANLQLNLLFLQIQLRATHKPRGLQLKGPIEKLFVFHPSLVPS
jgi:hypothetical protein